MEAFFEAITEFIAAYGYLAVFIWMTLESALIPIPSEIIMPFGGFLAAQGELSLLGVAVAGALGNVLGSWIAYWLGFRYGHAWLLKIPFIREHELKRAEGWFARYGIWASFLGRLMPAIRTYISLPLGVARVPLLAFTTLTFLGSLLWSYFLALVGFQLGEAWHQIEAPFRIVNIVIALTLLALVGWWLWRRRTGKK